MAQIKLTFKDLLTEDEIIDKFKFSKPQLDNLRKEGNFPVVDVCKGIRMYFIQDVLAWCKYHRSGIQDI